MHYSGAGLIAFGYAGEVIMFFLGNVLRNNSAIMLHYISDEEDWPPEDGLVCLTNRIPCCADDSTGSWYNPDGSRVSTEVPTEGEFYQFYVPDRQAIVLSRADTAYIIGGLFTCEILDRDGTIQRLYIGSGKFTQISYLGLVLLSHQLQILKIRGKWWMRIRSCYCCYC